MEIADGLIAGRLFPHKHHMYSSNMLLSSAASVIWEVTGGCSLSRYICGVSALAFFLIFLETMSGKYSDLRKKVTVSMLHPCLKVVLR